MKRIVMVLAAVCAITLFSFTTKKSMVGAKIHITVDGVDYNLNYEDVKTNGDDIDETPIAGQRTGNPVDIHIIVCPGYGVACPAIYTFNGMTYVYSGAKKAAGSPNYIVVAY